MALIKETTGDEFDLTAVKKGWLMWCKHKSWDFDRKGIITSAKKDELIVQFYPEISNVTNHTIIPIGEVVAGQWHIRWSNDLTEVYEYPEPEEPSGDPEPDGEP